MGQLERHRPPDTATGPGDEGSSVNVHAPILSHPTGSALTSPGVGLYREHVVPRLVDLACGAKGFDRWRARAAQGLGGTVVEIGFGSGLNVPHYPPDVDVVLAVEPAGVARRLAARRVQASSVPFEHVGLDGQQIPLEDGSCDAALCTFTLCTVPDPDRALAEFHRILRPGGAVHFLE